MVRDRSGQTAGEARADGLPAYLRIDHVTVYVRDLDRSLRFYIDQLGFDLAFDARLQSGVRLVSVAPPDGSTVIRLIAPDPGSPQYELIGRPTSVVFVSEDALAQFRLWSEHGVRFTYTPRLKRIRYDGQPVRRSNEPGSAETPPVWGGIFARFVDVDGNSFALVSLDDVTREIEAQRRAAAEKRELERRAARELEIATQVQARLFPQTLPACTSLEYDGRCIQAREVGGDYYDFLDLGRQRLGLVIADIAGKGIAAALLMANLQANLRSQCAVASDEPERFLRSVNRLFYENTAENAYATLLFAEYDQTLRRLRYANCGHVDGLLFHADGALDRLASTCTVLGLFHAWDCGIRECPMGSGDTLVLYTDGITEAFSAEGEEFGDERLVETVRRHLAQPPRELMRAVLDCVVGFSPGEQHDDMTILVARCPAKGFLQPSGSVLK